MRDSSAGSNSPSNKEGETVIKQIPQWGKCTSITSEKSSDVHGCSTATSTPSSSLSLSSVSFSSQLSSQAASYERLSNGSLSEGGQDFDILTPLTCHHSSTSSMQESSETINSFPSPRPIHPALDGVEDRGVGIPSREGVRVEIVREDFGVDTLRNKDHTDMTVEHPYTPASGDDIAEQMPPTSSPLLRSSLVISSPHSTTSSMEAATSRGESLTPSSSPHKPSSSSTLLSHSAKAPWMLLVWCHLSQILAGGLLKSLAVFLDDILQEFDSSVAFMGWMFSLEAFFFGLTCPFASFATKKLGPRVVMMVGGLINGGGILMASLATNIIVVGVGISAIAGTGSSMIYVAALVTVRKNFHTFYAIANGLTLAGVSVAVFTFPPIIRVLINNFGWRGALFILSAISLNTMVTGALMKDGGHTKKPKRPSDGKGETKPFVSKSCNTKAPGASQNSEKNDDVSCTLRKSCLKISGSSNTGVTFKAVDDINVNCRLENDHTSISCKMGLRSVYIDGEITSVPMPLNGNARPYRRPSISEKYVKLIVANITHGLLGVVAFLWSMANTATMKYLVAAGVERGLTSIQGAMLLSATGVTQCLSLLVNGVIVSKGWMTPLQLYLGVFFLMAGAGFGLAMFQHYVVGLVCSAMFGLGTGTIVSLNLVIQRTLDPRAGAQAAGWLMFLEGVGGCIGGFCIGAVRDMSGSYTISFLVSGVVTSVAASLVIAILVIRRVKRGH